VLDRPVEDVVILEALTNKQVTEELAKVGVIGLVIEVESTSVVQEDAKLAWEAKAEDIGGYRHLLLHDPAIFLLLGGGLEPLPREGTTQEVHEYICKGLEVITTGLLNRDQWLITDQALFVAIKGIGVASGGGLGGLWLRWWCL
jgi:hypothetical protein